MTKTDKIIKFIEDNGGFDNFRNWSITEVTTWVKSYFECRADVARRVAERII